MLLIIDVICALILAMVLRRPDLPLSKAITSRCAALVEEHATLGRATIAIGFSLFLYGAIWALQGDAPLFLAMILPELAAWFSAFEIATLVDAVVAVGVTVAATRSVGLNNYLRGRMRARRTHAVSRPQEKQANDDEPGGWALAA